MNEIVIYTKDWCGYCRAAKQLLEQLGQAYQEIDVTSDQAGYEEMLGKSDGRTSVPQIFFNGRGIGGYTDLARLVRENKFPPQDRKSGG